MSAVIAILSFWLARVSVVWPLPCQARSVKCQQCV